MKAWYLGFMKRAFGLQNILKRDSSYAKALLQYYPTSNDVNGNEWFGIRRKFFEIIKAKLATEYL